MVSTRQSQFPSCGGFALLLVSAILCQTLIRELGFRKRKRREVGIRSCLLLIRGTVKFLRRNLSETNPNLSERTPSLLQGQSVLESLRSRQQGRLCRKRRRNDDRLEERVQINDCEFLDGAIRYE